jgi:hypothetical protein
VLNEAFFDEITSEQQAYWLGFITADGCVMDAGNGYVLSVVLSVRDVAHLERLRDDLGSTQPISSRDKTVRGNVFTHATFRVNSRRLVRSLMRLGVTPRKSATAQPWSGPPDLMPHYWRGLFDGDGSIYQTSRDGVWNLSQIGSEACIRAFAEWSRGVCGSRAVARPHSLSPSCWTWTVGGRSKPQMLAKALYGDATVSLARKQERADELMALDLDALKAATSLKLSIAHREAWAAGRYANRKWPPTPKQSGR